MATTSQTEIQKLDGIELTRFKLELLYRLVQMGPSKGLAIKDALSNQYDSKVNHGRLYPNLDELVEDGYIDKSERDKRTNEYVVTEAGRELLLTDLEHRKEMLADI